MRAQRITVERFPEPQWRRRPVPKPPRVLSHRTADPRQALADAVAAGGQSYAALSRMIGRADGYLQRFVVDGCPRALNARDHRLLADFFGLDERGLGVRDLWADRA